MNTVTSLTHHASSSAANKKKDSREPVPVFRYQYASQPTQRPMNGSHLIKQNRVLLTIRAVFPFDLFPDVLIIDENKVNVYIHDFFFNKDVRSFSYKDIQFVEIVTSVIFASLQIKVFGFPNDNIIINYLKKDDARRARRMIQGLMDGTKGNVDFSQLSTQDLTTQSELLGSSHGG